MNKIYVNLFLMLILHNQMLPWKMIKVWLLLSKIWKFKIFQKYLTRTSMVIVSMSLLIYNATTLFSEEVHVEL